MRNIPMTQAALEMKNFRQNDKESLLDHGISVAKNLWRLRAALKSGQAGHLFIPDVVMQNREWILAETQNYNWREIRKAVVMHDLGKMRDRDNHASVSADLYRQLGGSDFGAQVIREDMTIHCLKAADCQNFKKHPDWVLLYLIGLAAINANSHAWGLTSTNWKIKQRHFEQRAKRLFGVV